MIYQLEKNITDAHPLELALARVQVAQQIKSVAYDGKTGVLTVELKTPDEMRADIYPRYGIEMPNAPKPVDPVNKQIAEIHEVLFDDDKDPNTPSLWQKMTAFFGKNP